jgi:predicted nucleic acid-binding protein
MRSAVISTSACAYSASSEASRHYGRDRPSAPRGSCEEVVRFDLLAGVRDDELEALEQFFSALSWVPVNEGVSRTAGLLARKHRRTHSGIDDVDYLIAATALVLDTELLTTNERYFPMLSGLRASY